MKREAVLLEFGIFLLAFIEGVYSLEIIVNSPQEGANITLNDNEPPLIDLNMSTNEGATCKVQGFFCPLQSNGENLCIYSTSLDLSTTFVTQHLGSFEKSYWYLGNPEEDRGDNGWWNPEAQQCWTTPTALKGGTGEFYSCCFDYEFYQVDCHGPARLSYKLVIPLFSVFFPTGGISTPGIINISCKDSLNQTFTKTIYLSFQYEPCTPNLKNSTWSDWSNISCLSTGFMNQTRNLTQYDSNPCSNSTNKTIYEYRAILPCPINNQTNTTIFLSINSPSPGIYNHGRLNLNLSSNVIFSRIDFIDNSKRIWTNLCKNYNTYSKLTTFNDGQHNLTFRGTLSNSQTIFNQTSFLIDTKDPQISTTKPQSRRYTNGSFYIKYSEDNCQSLKLSINSQEVFSNPCDSGRNVEKFISYNLSKYNGQEIEYQFKIIDIANNTKESKATNIKVDTTSPEIKYLNYSIDGKNVNFNIPIFNEDKNSFNKVEYLENLESKPIWRSLCISLKNNICYKKVNFKPGNHDLTIMVTDKAGNSVEKEIEFSV